MSETTLGELAQSGVLSIGDGYRTKQSELDDEGFRIIRVADIKDGRISLDSPDFVSTSFQRQIGAKRATAGDVLLTTKGTVGRVAIMPDARTLAVYSPQLCWFRVADPSVISSRFLAYWLQSDAFLAQSSYMQGNTDMAPYISLSDLRSSKITLPSSSEQQAIAEVLGALDDKITANTALAATAAQLASTDFAATARLAEWGPRFEEIADISGGGTPSTKNPALWDGDIWWATPTDMTALVGPYLESTSRRITPAGLAACSSKLFAPGAILMTSRATIGALAINGVPTALNQGFIAVEPHDTRLLWWLFHEMESRVEEFISWANGATFLELSRGSFKRLPVRVPEETVLSDFHSRVTPLHDVARRSLAENRTLAATRDTLLPQLMSGRLRVDAAEAAASEAGA